jgi:hypothetical protein
VIYSKSTAIIGVNFFDPELEQDYDRFETSLFFPLTTSFFLLPSLERVCSSFFHLKFLGLREKGDLWLSFQVDSFQGLEISIRNFEFMRKKGISGFIDLDK